MPDDASRNQLQAEHRYLERLMEGVARRLAPEVASEERLGAFGELAAELEVHFEQEDRLYYPSIAALAPDHKERLAELTRRHQAFLQQLRAIADRLAHDDLEAARSAFEAFRADFRRHETIEEAILSEIDAER